MPSIGLFVDVSNVYIQCRKKHGRKLDFQKLYNLVTDLGSLYQAHAYGTYTSNDAIGFQTFMRNIGYQGHWQRVAVRWEGDKPEPIAKHNMGVGIAMDIVRIIDRVDMICLVTSDPDISPCVHWVREQGVKSVIYGARISAELKSAADRCFEFPPELLSEEQK